MFADEAYAPKDGLIAPERLAVRATTFDTAFAEAAGAQLPRAYRIAGYLLADATDGQDAVQEACIRAWRAWPQLRDHERFSAWFSQILVNVCRSKLRGQGRRRTEPIEAHEVEGSDPFRAALARDEVGRALPALSDDLRIVVVLRYWGDLSLADIAERLGIPIGTVKSRLHAAHQALRRAIEPPSVQRPVGRGNEAEGSVR